MSPASLQHGRSIGSGALTTRPAAETDVAWDTHLKIFILPAAPAAADGYGYEGYDWNDAAESSFPAAGLE